MLSVPATASNVYIGESMISSILVCGLGLKRIYLEQELYDTLNFKAGKEGLSARELLARLIRSWRSLGR